jgi:hypothetical protein
LIEYSDYDANMMKKRYKFAVILFAFGVVILFTACMTLNAPQFGQLPQHTRLEQIKQSPHYVNAEFTYPVATPMLLEGESSIKIFWDNFWKEKQQTVPKQALPSIKTNLHALW